MTWWYHGDVYSNNNYLLNHILKCLQIKVFNVTIKLSRRRGMGGGADETRLDCTDISEAGWWVLGSF